jgi:hypothetical protein
VTSDRKKLENSLSPETWGEGRERGITHHSSPITAFRMQK